QGSVFFGGSFTASTPPGGPFLAKWSNNTWTNIGTGIASSIYVIGLTLDQAGNLYAGGEFSAAGGIMASNIAKWNGTSWTNLGIGFSGLQVYALAVDKSGNLYAGGNFSTAFNSTGSVTVNGI